MNEPAHGSTGSATDIDAAGPSAADLHTEGNGDDLGAWRALGELYHRYTTGLLLALVTRHGTARTAEVARRTFRRQHLELFLPGLAKLGLTDLPPAVACAKYHVLSNALGGVRVSWIPENDRKSWVRYHPPRWIFDGTAICAVPTEVSRAMMWGWHAHNGVSLGNDRLGFVCTMQTTDGQPGLEGYYIEADRPLAPEDRLRFAPGERPPGPPADLPLPAWDPRRLAKVERNYSAAYIRSILPELCAVLGPADAGAVGRLAGRQVAMQYHPTIMDMLDDGSTQAAPFAVRFARLLRAQGDDVTVETGGPYPVVRQSTWRLGAGLVLPEDAFDAWNGLWEGLAAMEDLRLVVHDRLDCGDGAFTWELRPSP